MPTRQLTARDVEPNQLVRADGGTDSPYATTQPVRISGECPPRKTRPAPLAGRFLLRHSRHTRTAYAGDLAEWLAFARRLGVDPLRAKVDHADAYALVLRE